ncbi:hypothetical protein ACTXMB_00555 [Arthrobacter rhombi]|uniref:hypothetical protein n=1 Tax=Micrococcaceae TaxID=1268 RepID=UPI00117B4CAB|nr:hypothetical protein [Glutamicibacter sp. BW78]
MSSVKSFNGHEQLPVGGHMHQILWQLRLGEHIEDKRRIENEQDIPPASIEEIEGKRGETRNNAAYAFVLPENPFENVGRPGYEAQDRVLSMLMQCGPNIENEDPGDDN